MAAQSHPPDPPNLLRKERLITSLDHPTTSPARLPTLCSQSSKEEVPPLHAHPTPLLHHTRVFGQSYLHMSPKSREESSKTMLRSLKAQCAPRSVDNPFLGSCTHEDYGLRTTKLKSKKDLETSRRTGRGRTLVDNACDCSKLIIRRLHNYLVFDQLEREHRLI